MPNAKPDFKSGHRERLREKFLMGKLVDYEVLELLLTYAIPRVDVKPIARALLKKFGGTHSILTAPLSSLEETPGIGKCTAIFIKAVYELMLLDYKNYLNETPIFRDFNVLTNYCKTLLAQKLVEEFHVLYLDNNYRLLTDDLHSLGTINWAGIYPREIAKRALDINASHVVLMHNHPNGDGNFSTEDLKLTSDIQEILRAISVSVFDHLLFADGKITSGKNVFLF